MEILQALHHHSSSFLLHLFLFRLLLLDFGFSVDPICSSQTGKCLCSSGYRWNAGLSTCEDINECRRKKLNLCPPSSICLNLEGSYQCKIQDKSSCDMNPCNKYEKCKEVDQSRSFICSCKQGYKYNGTQCTPLTGCGKCGIAYTVIKKSESMQSIASYCGLKLTTLMRLNPAIVRSSVVQKGHVLNISCSERDSADCGPCGARYIPGTDETLSSISETCGINELYLRRIGLHASKLDIPCGLSSFGKVFQCGFCGSSVVVSDGPVPLMNISKSCNVSLEQIQSLNPALNDTIGSNTTVYLPCNDNIDGCGPCGSVYKVMEGETAEIIASNCGISLSSISHANPQVNNIGILIDGQLLNIPCGLALRSHATTKDFVKLNSWVTTSAFLSFIIAISLFSSNNDILHTMQRITG